MAIELKERFDGLTYITERNSAGKTIIKFKGPFQEMADIVERKNRNGRRYTSKLWKRVLESQDIKEKLSTKRMLGELDHPSDEGQIRRTSHIVTKIEPNYEEGIVYGELELLNLDQGDPALLRALVEQEVQICVSSRGYGEMLEDDETIDPDTFRLITWDVVLDPSVSIAKLNKVSENYKLGKLFVESANGVIITGKDKPQPQNQQAEEKQKPINKESKVDEKIIALMNEVTALKVEVATLKANEKQYQEKIEDKNQGIARLEKANAEVSKKVEELEKEGDTASNLLESFSGKEKSLKTESAELKSKVEALTKENAEAEKTLGEMTAALKAEKELNTKAEATIKDLTAKLEGEEDADAKAKKDAEEKAKKEAEDKAAADAKAKEEAEGKDGEEDDGKDESEEGEEGEDDGKDEGEEGEDEDEPEEEGKMKSEAVLNIFEKALMGNRKVNG